MPTYHLTGLGLDKPRVIEAPNPGAARQHVAKDLTIRKIEVSEAFALASEGAKLEKAGEPVGNGSTGSGTSPSSPDDSKEPAGE